MAIIKRLIAVFTISHSVPAYLDDMGALMLKLTTAPGNTYVTLDPLVVTAINDRLTTLTNAQKVARTRQEGAAAARNTAYAASVNDANMLKAEVQLAADAAGDVLAAREIITGCGMRVKETSPRVKADFAVKNVADIQSMVRFASKAAAAGVRASYVFQTSPNGVTFTTAVTSPKSSANYQTALAPGSKLYCRGQVITTKDVGPPVWSQTVIVIIA